MNPARIIGGYVVDRDPFEMATLARYHAVDPHTLERVIVEEPHTYIQGDGHFMDLFQEGVAGLAALGPVAPRVLGAFGRGSIAHALVREHIEGITLDRVLVALRAAREHLPIEVACAIVRELCDLLRRPVRVRLGMRDIVITPEGHVRAKPELVVLQARQVVGAAINFIDVGVAYEPPEIVRGTGPMPTSSMFTLGVMLYELIANRHPHSTATDSMFEMLSRMQTSLPPPIQAFRSVPPKLAAFLDRALARDPRQRFASWDDFVAELPQLAPAQILESMPLPPEREPPEPLEDWSALPDDNFEPVAVPPYVPRHAPAMQDIAIDGFEYRGDGRPMLAVGSLLVDVRPVSAAEYQRFVLALHGELDPEVDEAPHTDVSHRDAMRYAAWAGKRLPTEAEWSVVTRELRSRLYTGEVWEWTTTPATAGFVVCGGRWRDRVDLAPQITNRSFDTEPAPDVGFRCVCDR